MGAAAGAVLGPPPALAPRLNPGCWDTWATGLSSPPHPAPSNPLRQALAGRGGAGGGQGGDAEAWRAHARVARAEQRGAVRTAGGQIRSRTLVLCKGRRVAGGSRDACGLMAASRCRVCLLPPLQPLAASPRHAGAPLRACRCRRFAPRARQHCSNGRGPEQLVGDMTAATSARGGASCAGTERWHGGHELRGEAATQQAGHC